MAEDRKQSISLLLGPVRFPFNIDPSREQSYREAAENVNKVYEWYKSKYPTVDELRLMCLTCFQLSTKAIDNDYSTMVEDLEVLNSKLEEYIKSDPGR
ncbi:MAG: cell division protein ZapA [Bacteroidales bacterium]|nr:cell division protein ZapA [Bacteroidales bacterium]